MPNDFVAALMVFCRWLLLGIAVLVLVPGACLVAAVCPVAKAVGVALLFFGAACMVYSAVLFAASLRQKQHKTI